MIRKEQVSEEDAVWALSKAKKMLKNELRKKKVTLSSLWDTNVILIPIHIEKLNNE